VRAFISNDSHLTLIFIRIIYRSRYFCIFFAKSDSFQISSLTTRIAMALDVSSPAVIKRFLRRLEKGSDGIALTILLCIAISVLPL